MTGGYPHFRKALHMWWYMVIQVESIHRCSFVSKIRRIIWAGKHCMQRFKWMVVPLPNHQLQGFVGAMICPVWVWGYRSTHVNTCVHMLVKQCHKSPIWIQMVFIPPIKTRTVWGYHDLLCFTKVNTVVYMVYGYYYSVLWLRFTAQHNFGAVLHPWPVAPASVHSSFSNQRQLRQRIPQLKPTPT